MTFALILNTTMSVVRPREKKVVPFIDDSRGISRTEMTFRKHERNSSQWCTHAHIIGQQNSAQINELTDEHAFMHGHRIPQT